MSNRFFAPIISTVSVSPASGSGGTVFSAEVVATGFPNVRLSYQWRLDDVNIPGATRPTFTASEAGTLTVFVTAENNQGIDTRLSGSVHVCRNCGVPQISEVGIAPDGGTVGDLFAATVRVDGVPTPVVTYQWLIDGTAIPGAVGPVYAPDAAGALSVLVTASNTEGSSSVESAAVQVAAVAVAAPIVASLAIVPASGRVGDDFEAVADVTGQEPIALSYQWIIDGTAIDGATGPCFAATAAGALSVRLTASNAGGTVSAESPPSAVAPTASAPHVKAADILPSSGRVGDTFVVTETVTGDPEPEIGYQWFLDGVMLDGIDGPSYTAEAEGSLFVRVSAINEAGSDTRESGAAMVTAATVAPSIASAALSPAAGRVGDVFAAVAVASGSPEPEFAFAWYLDGVPVAGETGQIYRAAAPGLLAAEVTATNEAGLAQAMTAAVPVAPALAAPAIASLVLAPEDGRVGDLFTATVAASGEPAPDLAFRWTLDGVAIPDAESDQIVADAPGLLAVEVTATNAAGADAASTAVAVAPAKTMPAVASVAIVPPAGVVGDIFTIEADVTGEPRPSLAYQWLLDGAPIDGATEASLEAPAPGALSVRVTATNSLGSDVRLAEPAAVSSAPIAPVVRLADILPNVGRVGDTFTILTDVTGDPEPALAFAWLLDGVPIDGADGPSHTPTSPGTLFARVRATNVAGSDERESGAVLVMPAAEPPSVENAAIAPGSGNVGTVFAASATVTGLPEPTVTFQWTLDGQPIPGATAQEHLAAAPGLLGVTVTARNEAGIASAGSSPVNVAAESTLFNVFIQGVFEDGVFA